MESIDTIESALSEAIQSVRGLSYRSDPGIVRRCGLRSAIGYLCQDAGVAFDDSSDLATVTPDQAEVLFRIASELILDAAEMAPGFPLSLRLKSDGFALSFSSSTGVPDGVRFPSETTLLGLRPLVQSSLIEIVHRQQSGETIVTATMRDARV